MVIPQFHIPHRRLGRYKLVKITTLENLKPIGFTNYLVMILCLYEHILTKQTCTSQKHKDLLPYMHISISLFTNESNGMDVLDWYTFQLTLVWHQLPKLQIREQPTSLPYFGEGLVGKNSENVLIALSWHLSMKISFTLLYQ